MKQQGRGEELPREGPVRFPSFFLGGFECSTHRIHTGKRLDVVHSTRHDEFCLEDYQRLTSQGIRSAREGLRWHLIEPTPGQYDFSTAEPMLRASKETGVQIIWDLCHYGWPEDLDIFTPEFVHRFTAFAEAFGHWMKKHAHGPIWIAPINEISFFSWAGGDSAYLPPRCRGRGFELKAQLARAVNAAIEVLADILPEARFFHMDPIINIQPHPNRPEDGHASMGHHHSQYQGWDMIGGRLWPQLNGRPRHLDVIGVNYYSDNQWIHNSGVIRRNHPLYRPLRELLVEVHERYQRPMFIAETGCEDDERVEWLRYICEESQAAMLRGVPLLGICLYPIVNHPGWDDDRHCHNGLWDYADDHGHREIYEPLAAEIQRWRRVFEPQHGAGQSTQPTPLRVEALARVYDDH